MMVSAAGALALACLVSVIHSSPLPCENLLHPSAPPNLQHLEGTWALIAGSLSPPPHLEHFKQRDSASVTFSKNTTDSNISYTRGIRLNNECQHTTYNITLEGRSITYEGSNLTAGLVHTSCRDCILMRMIAGSVSRQHLYLFSRRRQLEQQEMEEFTAQVACLNMPPPVVMDPTKELCPEKTTSQPEEQPKNQVEQNSH